MMDLYPGNTVASGILHVIVQVSLILGIVVLALRWQRRKGAALRHTICTWGLAAALLCPLATWVIWSQGLTGIRFSPPAPITAPAPPTAMPEAAPVTATDGATARHAAETTPAATTEAASAPAAPTVPIAPAEPSTWTLSLRWDWLQAALLVFFGAWLAGVLFGLIRFAHGLMQQSKLLRDLRPVTLDAYPDLARAVSEALGVNKVPRLAVSPAVRSPVCVGLFRPRILLPSGLLESLSDAELRAILIHEGAHALRHDHWVGLLQRIATIVLWMHPWVHMVSRELSKSREEICDNYVLRHENKIAYARMLLCLSEDPSILQGATATVGLAPPRWGLEDRVNGILDRARNLMIRTQTGLRVALAVGFVGFTLLVSSASIRSVADELIEDSANVNGKPAEPRANSETDTKAPRVTRARRQLPKRVLPLRRWDLGAWGGTGKVEMEKTGTRLTVTDPKAGKMAISQAMTGADLSRFERVALSVELANEKPYPVLASFGFQVGPEFLWVEAQPIILKKGTNRLSFPLWATEWKSKATGWHHRTTPQGKGLANHVNLVFHGLDRDDSVVVSGFRLIRGECPADVPADAKMDPTEVPELLTPQQYDSPDVTRAGILRVHVLNLLRVFAADLKALGREPEAIKIGQVVQDALAKPLRAAAPAKNE